MIRLIYAFSTDEGFKSSAFLAEWIFSADKSSLPMNRALGSPLSLFEYAEQPENKGYMSRMQSAYEGASKLEPLTAILHGICIFGNICLIFI